MKRVFIYFLLVLNAFFISYAYGLNSLRVKVVDHSLPPVKPPAVTTAKPAAKAISAKPTATKGKADTASGAKAKHSHAAQANKVTGDAKKNHATHKPASKAAQ